MGVGAGDGEPPIKVLVIEDHGELSDIYKFQLQRLGDFEVLTAKDGISGLDAIDDTFDLVLMDWQLPHLSGQELLQQIDNKHPDLTTIVVSGFEPPSNIDQLPCDDYLVKPVSKKQWVELVENLELPKAEA
jgi:CheY-like chemotaxis protein